MEVDESLSDSESELEAEFDYLDLSSTDDEEDEENDIPAQNTRKRHAPRKWCLSDFDPKDLEFFNRISGLRKGFEIRENKPSHYFRAFFDNELMQKIVQETDNYQQQNSAPNVEKNCSLVRYECGRILMGLNRKNHLKFYWSTDKLITTPIFGELFTRNRYLSIMQYLHFADNNTEKEGKLRKIQPLIENLRKKFQKAVVPWENLRVDESLMLWKGRLSFKQYIPSKDTVLAGCSSCCVTVIRNSL